MWYTIHMDGFFGYRQFPGIFQTDAGDGEWEHDSSESQKSRANTYSQNDRREQDEDPVSRFFAFCRCLQYADPNLSQHHRHDHVHHKRDADPGAFIFLESFPADQAPSLRSKNLYAVGFLSDDLLLSASDL